MIELNHLLSKKWGTLDDGYGVGDGGGGRHGMVMVAAKNEERRASAADRPLPRVSTENVLAGNLDYFPAKQLPRVSAPPDEGNDDRHRASRARLDLPYYEQSILFM